MSKYDGSINIDTKIDTKGFNDGIKDIASIAKNGLSLATKTVAATGAALVAAVGTLGKASIDAYGTYEQLVGGIETLYSESAEKMVAYASEAYKTAQMSANDYMSLATSFSASLLQSVGGDTEKAAQKANSAIIDMADNANKMGTALEDIQNAYQGFAKQNYTMLDNLKLGYGGTKTEMERLLADAQAISGITYDVSSYADVVDAIHVIQEEMGIAGTSAKEGSATIQGSLAMTKAAYENLVAGLADSNADINTLVNNLVSSAASAFDNLTPVITTFVSAIPKAIEALTPTITDALPQLVSELLPELLDCSTALLDGFMSGMSAIFDTLSQIAISAISEIAEYAPTLVEMGVTLLQSLIDGLVSNSDTIASAATDVITTLTNGILTSLPRIIDGGLQLTTALAQGIAENISSITKTIVDVVIQIAEILTNPDTLVTLIEAGLQIILGLAEGLIEALPNLIEKLPEIINGIITALLESIPLIIDAGIQLLTALVDNLPDIILGIVEAIPELIDGIIQGLIDNTGSIIDAGVRLLVALAENQDEILRGIIKIVPQIISSIVSSITKNHQKMAEVGANLFKGLWEGIKSVKDWILSKIKGFCGDILGSVTSFFGIHSPSHVFRDLIGKNLALGVGVGFEVESDNVADMMTDDLKDITAKMAAVTDAEQMKLYQNFTLPTKSESYNNDNRHYNNVTQNFYTQTPTPSQVSRAARRAMEVH